MCGYIKERLLLKSEMRAKMFSMLSKRKKTNIIKESQNHDVDTGSPSVQASILSKRIDDLASHLKKNTKDNHSRRGLLGMVAKRQSLLKYLQKSNPKQHASLVKKLGLKK
jgi:small subunit ribosomal protein S15